ncbi:MAG: hypothetical protein K2X66_02480 [Cyanobacteria bacterium]|nr:hypothetical protein [Cyanobacteriota bacterium]
MTFKSLLLHRFTGIALITAFAVPLLFTDFKHVSLVPAAQAAKIQGFSRLNNDFPPSISASEVKVFLKGLERQTNKRNYLSYVRAIAWDGVVQETSNGQTLYLDRKTYLERRKDAFKDLTAYQFRQSIESVDVNGKKAYVRTTCFEKAEGPEGLKVSMIKEMGVLEKRKGKLYFTLLTTNTKQGGIDGGGGAPAPDANGVPAVPDVPPAAPAP